MMGSRPVELAKERCEWRLWRFWKRQSKLVKEKPTEV